MSGINKNKSMLFSILLPWDGLLAQYSPHPKLTPTLSLHVDIKLANKMCPSGEVQWVFTLGVHYYKIINLGTSSDTLSLSLSLSLSLCLVIKGWKLDGECWTLFKAPGGVLPDVHLAHPHRFTVWTVRPKINVPSGWYGLNGAIQIN